MVYSYIFNMHDINRLHKKTRYFKQLFFNGYCNNDNTV